MACRAPRSARLLHHLRSVRESWGVSPLDNQTSLSGEPPGRALARGIVKADIDLMSRVDAGIFCLDGFRRGPEMDPGTAFEIGYMFALGKALSAWTKDTREYPERVRSFFADTFGLRLAVGERSGSGARSGALRDPDGTLVHSVGCYQNAMIDIGIEFSGGIIEADSDWRAAFNRATSRLATILGTAAGRRLRA